MKPLKGSNLHVVGAGLIGTSIALAARQSGLRVTIEDAKLENEVLARDLLSGSQHGKGESAHQVDFVIVAVPPDVVGREVARALDTYSRAIVTDVASVKTKVINDVRGLSEALGRYVPSHPVAGREYEGPASARADLFKGRPWVITPLQENSESDLQSIESLVSGLGGSVQRMTPEEHDSLFATISHLPQLLSTLLSAAMVDIGKDVALAGQGLRDMTRLAESQVALWSEIITLNSEEILKSLISFKSRLDLLESAIEEKDTKIIATLFEEGKKGRRFFTGKHGGVPRDYVLFRIVIDDRPGVLGELFALCGKEKINVEDLTIEHSPNQETGLITLSISPDQKKHLEQALKEDNWRFHLDSSARAIR